MGSIELLLHTQLMTLCCQCRSEWPSFPCNCLRPPVTIHQPFTDFQWEAQCYLYDQRHGKHYNLITAKINHTGRIFLLCFDFIPFVKVRHTLNSFHRSTFNWNSSSLQELLCFLFYLNTVELRFFEPSLKMEIGYRKLEVQRNRGEIQLRFGHWALLLFSG